MKKLLCLSLMALFNSFAAEYEVKMLSFAKGQPMIFDPAVLQIAPGDTVTFVPTQRGHQAVSHLVPEGAQAFAGTLDEKFSVTLDKEGIYVYYCPPHLMMNMSGLIQVGKPVNRDKVDAGVAAIEAKATVNKGRLLGYLKQLDDLNAAQATDTQEPKSDTKIAAEGDAAAETPATPHNNTNPKSQP